MSDSAYAHRPEPPIPHREDCAPAAPVAVEHGESIPFGAGPGGLRYQRSAIQRQALPPPITGATHNGITAGENAAVKSLSGGRVDLHASGAQLAETHAADARLQAVGARSLAQGGTAIVSDRQDRGHELWHLAQQATQRVQASSMVNGQPLNDDPQLESEADRNGAVINRAAGPIGTGPAITQRVAQSGVIQAARTNNPKHARKNHFQKKSHMLSGPHLNLKKMNMARRQRGEEYLTVRPTKRWIQQLLLRQRRMRPHALRMPMEPSGMLEEENALQSDEAGGDLTYGMDEVDDIFEEEMPRIEDDTGGYLIDRMGEARGFFYEQLALMVEDASSDLINRTGVVEGAAWTYVLPELDSDLRKLLAAELFKEWMLVNGNSLWGDLVQAKLDALKIQLRLSKAQVIGDSSSAAAEFSASPSIYVPLVPKTTRSSLFTGTGVTHGSDTLKPVTYDPDVPSPAHELLEQFNKAFGGKKYGTTSKNVDQTIDKLTANKTLLKSSSTKTYDRPGSVEAVITKSKPTPGRTGSGETEVGWFGGDEEQILEGTRTIPYEGGHLVGDNLMDGDSVFDMYKNWNLAPQAKSFNNPLYITAMETAAVNALKKNAILKYTVNVSYPGDKYKIKASKVVKNAIDPTSEMKSKDTYLDAVDKYLVANPTEDKDFEFHARVPNYWTAEMEDTAKKKSISGSARQDQRGIFESAQVTGSTSYAPTGVEQFKFSLSVDSTLLAPPSTTAKVQKSTYSGANKVVLSARQKSFVTGTSAPALKIGNMSQQEINDIVKHATRSKAIHSYLQNNPIATLDDLVQVPGVSTATIGKLKAAGVVI